MLAHDTLAFAEEPEAFAEPRIMAFSAAEAAPAFSSVELAVIRIGERDRPVSPRPAGYARRVARLLFGIEAPLPFADHRLEALRRLANALRHRRGTDAAIAAALASGIAPEQIDVMKTRNPGQEQRT